MPVIDDDIRASMLVVIDVFKDFRDELLRSYGNIDFTVKSDDSQLTVLDVKVETELSSRLLAQYPGVGFEGEETGARGNSHRYWLVDPIDGTSSFIRGLPNCTNMAAFIVDNQPVAAVIHNIYDGTTYSAIKGEGALKDGIPIKVSQRRVMAVDNLNAAVHNEIVSSFNGTNVRAFQPLGAAGKSFTLVAEGKLEGVITLNGFLHSHDVAPGVLIVTEAGGEVVTFDGQPWNINSSHFAAGNSEFTEVARSKSVKLQQYIVTQPV